MVWTILLEQLDRWNKTNEFSGVLKPLKLIPEKEPWI